MTALRQFRLTALMEGWSYLILLFVAMPLKYAAGLPFAVRVVGSVHGLLFVVFVVTLYRVLRARQWPIGRAVTAFVCSIIPFGAFVFDASLRKEIAAGKMAS